MPAGCRGKISDYLYYRAKSKKAINGLERGLAGMVALNVALQQAETSQKFCNDNRI